MSDQYRDPFFPNLIPQLQNKKKSTWKNEFKKSPQKNKEQNNKEQKNSLENIFILHQIKSLIVFGL